MVRKLLLRRFVQQLPGVLHGELDDLRSKLAIVGNLEPSEHLRKALGECSPEALNEDEGKGPVEAYLDVQGIVDLAHEKGVDAIHPGYGFLSENPALPRACEQAGITFIGPSAGLLDLLEPQG